MDNEHKLIGTYYQDVTDMEKHEGHIPPAAYDQVGAIIAFESGELDEEGTIELFQHLLDTGLVWQLQGSYGRSARHLLDAGLIVRKDN